MFLHPSSAVTLVVTFVTLSWVTGGALGEVSLTGPDQDYLVKLHNDARDEETAKEMTHVSWDSSLASEAQSWTDGCKFSHQKGKPWGENLSANGYSTTRLMEQNLQKMFNLWMSEKQYNPGGTFEECCSQSSSKCCHYTQVIWSKSTKMGCGLTLCPSLSASWGAMKNMLYLACYYTPPGNKPAVTYSFDWRPYLPLD